MQRTVDDFLRHYFSRLVNHHENIYGIHQDAYVSKINYISKCDEILKFVDFIISMDKSIENDFLDVFLDDIINLLRFVNKLFEDEERLNIIYSEFCKKSKADIEQEEFNKLLKKEYKLNHNRLKDLLNSKFFYLDKYLCYKINQSQIVKQFMTASKLPNIFSILDFIENQPKSKLNIKVDYASFELDDDVKYKQEDIKNIMELVNKPVEEKKVDDTEPLEQLIKYKKHIPYFKNMHDNEIRALVMDVKFRRYKKYEVVIQEYEDDKDIYFLVEGGCDIVLNGKELGLINPKNIFGEFAFITDKLRSATIQANQQSVIISFKINLAMFDQDPMLFPQLYKNISGELVKKFYNLNVKFISMQ